MIDKGKWLVKRLQCMSLPEILHRVVTLIKNSLEKLGLIIVSDPPSPNLVNQSISWFGKNKSEQPASYCQASDKTIQGLLNVFDLRDQYVGTPPQWNQDPLSGKNAPMVFGKTLDYRNEKLVGDIKYLWEPSRHLHLVTLAQAYSLTQSEDYLNVLKLHLDSWFDQCPYLMGPQWVSSLELGIRLINWYLVWQLVGGLESTLFKGKEGEEFRDRWLKSIYQHVHFIKGHYSRYSSANNHLIGEASGVFIATVGWPFWSEFNQWRKEAASILERETLLQNTADGVNREQAIAYQQFVLDFLIISKLTADSNQCEFSSAWDARLESMLEFVASIMDVAGHIPMIGDADDGFVVGLVQGENNWCPFRSLLATGAILFNRADFAVKSGGYDGKSRWLLGDQALEKFESLSANDVSLPVRREFVEGGYYILGDKFESEEEIKIIADAGSLGYLGIAAHGHADALSFTLSVSGEEILIDPGTYTYHTQKEWRDYFRGTAAHNTVCIDGQDQSVIGGNFMWLRKAEISDVEWSVDADEDSLCASHNGYMRFSDPVRHTRTIRYDKAEKKIFVADTIACSDEHLVELSWHFSELCKVEKRPEGVVIVNGKAVVVIKIADSEKGQLKVVSGGSDPLQGWISRRFGMKEPVSTVVFSRKVHGDTELHTEFEINPIDISDSSSSI
ncbi:MAG: alginate lyase family protein [Gammaproteobacteria bacterium]|nr:alginate lyase family protein [Gammaproteobacteria bacterium]